MVLDAEAGRVLEPFRKYLRVLANVHLDARLRGKRVSVCGRTKSSREYQNFLAFLRARRFNLQKGLAERSATPLRDSHTTAK
jgi:hypothetical protein